MNETNTPNLSLIMLLNVIYLAIALPHGPGPQKLSFSTARQQEQSLFVLSNCIL